MFALTSLAPGHSFEVQKAALESWRAAGLSVRSFNHVSEIKSLKRTYGNVTIEPVETTNERVPGRHFIPITAMLNWAADHDASVLIINSDIELVLAPIEFRRIQRLCDDGLCYFRRHNHDGDRNQAVIEPYGLDAFLLHGRVARDIPESSLSMGQPWWDYWLPFMCASRKLPLYSVEFPAAFHLRHVQKWSPDDWHRESFEFDRFAKRLGPDRSLEACRAMAIQVFTELNQRRKAIVKHSSPIRTWVESQFAHGRPKIFFELGAHRGDDTAWLARLPNVTVHAFEPDPRNKLPAIANVVVNRLAISDRNGTSDFVLSGQARGHAWTYSSSLKKPKNHLLHYPDVSFGGTIKVGAVRLDDYCASRGIQDIDFIWSDIQGAEGEMIRGAQNMLARTRYLYTEYSNDELYEGQLPLDALLKLLPNFRVLEIWERKADGDVLLQNISCP